MSHEAAKTQRAGIPSGSILARLGIFGADPLETALLAGLVTGDPILFVGAHGSAKTLLCERLAQALGLRFWAYDASKALFEDVIGFPNPADLARGVVSYVPTPLSLWDKEFVLIDEISRASPSMQNKWLEVVRSRRLMGLPLSRLKYVVAAMNPPSYLGAIPLDPALAGRFAFILPMPEFKDLSPEDEAAVVEHVSSSDAPMLGGSRPGPGLEPAARALLGVIDAARSAYPDVEDRFGEAATSYVLTLAAALVPSEASLDGRRCGMLRRNILAALAVHEVRGELDPTDGATLGRQILETAQLSMPFAATEDELKAGTLLGAHAAAVRAFHRRFSRRRQVAKLKILGARDLAAAIGRLPDVADDLSKGDHQVLLSRIEQRLKRVEDPEQVADAYVALKTLVRTCQERRVETAPEILIRAATLLEQVTRPPVHREVVRLTALSLRDLQASEDKAGLESLVQALRVAGSLTARLFEPEDPTIPWRYHQRLPATQEAVKKFESIRDAVRGKLQQTAYVPTEERS
jgi:MoxR-like ATPase